MILEEEDTMVDADVFESADSLKPPGIFKGFPTFRLCLVVFNY